MDANTGVEQVDAFVIYEPNDPTAREVVLQIEKAGVTIVQGREPSPRLSDDAVETASALVPRARTIVLVFGRSGWGRWPKELLDQARSSPKPLIPIILEGADGKLLGLDPWLADVQRIRWLGPNSVGELLSVIERYRSPYEAMKSEFPRSEAIFDKISPTSTTGRRAGAGVGRPEAAFSSASPSSFSESTTSKASPEAFTDSQANPPPSSSDAPPQATEPLQSVLAERGIKPISTLASRLLEIAAALIGPVQETDSQLTTTRLIVAAYELGAELASESDRDAVGMAALRVVLDREFTAFRTIRQDYPGRESYARSTGRTVVTSDVDAVLSAAMTCALGEIDGARLLTANALVASVLDQPDTRLAERLTQVGIARGDIQKALFNEVQRSDPARIGQWATALKQPAAATDTAAPATLAEFDNDNSDRAGLVDRLGVEAEARAFARVAAAKRVTPPLAFGIFGDWGSGKSFFMRLLYEYVEKLQKGTVDEAKSGEVFHTSIVQIRFNAWHYIDTNLWASLVDHIFFELNDWTKDSAQGGASALDKLSSARSLTIDSVTQLIGRRKDQKDAADRLAKAEKELAKAQKDVGTTPRVVWGAVKDALETAEFGKHMASASRELGFDHLATSAEQLKSTLDELKVEANRARFEGQAIRNKLMTGPYLVPALAVIILLPPLLLLGVKELSRLAEGDLKDLLSQINGLMLGAATILTTMAVAVKRATGTVRSAISRLEQYRGDLDDVIAKESASEKGKVREAEAALATQVAAVQEARALLKSLTDRVAEAASEYISGSGRTRLLNFVRQRATDGQYTKYLGLVSVARRDFSELSVMMSGADDAALAEAKKQLEDHKKEVGKILASADAATFLQPDECALLSQTVVMAPDKQVRSFQRIILYIDDLDRCPPDKVVEVLQAVHLLLAFPLFVVVVAVDVRWVSQSLEAYYEKLLLGDRSKSGEDVATPRDYLEKIFQVPYWVRPMTKGSSRNLLLAMAAPLRDAAGRGQSGESEAGAGKDGGQPPPSANSPGTTQPGATVSGAGPVPPQSDEEKRRAAEAAEEEDRRKEAERERSQQVAAKALDLTTAERAFMRTLAPYVGRTPRRALRFLNVYRVIKASMDMKDLRKLEDEGGYRALMVQLAVSTAAPAVQKEWFELVRGMNPGASVDDLLKRLDGIPTIKKSPEAELIASAVAALRASYLGVDLGPGDDQTLIEKQDVVAKLIAAPVKYLRDYSKTGQRYSFSDAAPSAE